MKLPTNRCGHRPLPLLRPLLTSVAAALVAVSQSNCTGLGLGGKDDREDPAIAALEDEPEKKRRGFSLFNLARERNAHIDEDAQMTRRDRLAARSSNSDFQLQPFPTAAEDDPAAMMDTIPGAHNANTPEHATITPTIDTAASAAEMAALETTNPRDRLALPTLDSDYPQPDSPPAPEPRSGAPLQPKLPGDELIIPPAE